MALNRTHYVDPTALTEQEGVYFTTTSREPCVHGTTDENDRFLESLLAVEATAFGNCGVTFCVKSKDAHHG